MFSEEQIKRTTKKAVDHINPLTTGGWWAKIRNVSTIVFITCGLVTQLPITLPVAVVSWASYIAYASGSIAFGTNLNKSKK